MIRRVIFLMVLVMVFSTPTFILAEDYPTKAITLINPLPPGGILDLIARPFAAVAEKYLGKPIVVVTKTGASGAVGTLAAAQAKPDGYTLCMGWSAQTQLIIGEILAGRKPSFTMNDFILLGQVLSSPNIFLVQYDSPWKTIQQALEDIKANPNKYSFSTGGIYNVNHIPWEILMAELGLKLRHVPFQGAGPAVIAHIGGHVQFSAQFPGVSLPKIKAKQLRALAQFGEKRVKYYEDIPTFKELGYNVVYSPWFGLLVPKGTPAPIAEKLQTLVRQVTIDPMFIDIIEKAGDQIDYADAKTLEKRLEKEYETTYNIIQRLEKEKKH